MKIKLLILQIIIVALFFVNKTNAQMYHPMLGNYNEWDVYVNLIPVVNKSTFIPYQSGKITTQDTLIGSLVYKKVYSMSDDSLFSNSKPLFIREDTIAKKVFVLSADSTSERLLYDFSMQVGDSTYLSFKYPSPFGFGNGYYHVDSVSTINTLAGIRNVFYLTSYVNQITTFPVYQLEWIEGAGSTISPVYLDEDIGSGPPAAIFTGCNKFFLALTCAFTDGNAIYHDSCMTALYLSWPSFGDSCIFNLVGGINENSFSALSVNVQPNPFTTSAVVKIKGDNAMYYASLRLRIVDALGRKKGEYLISNVDFEKGISINKQNFNDGIYFIQLFDHQALKAVSKIVIE
jgi:hypothetical protein